ncbi:YceI family protein [Flavobacterium litorale]|uniref:YceI family protein n=1 Tax=Flavobacterium litorale TaxID=2856519 RepID=A0ABX8V3V3_9FLAO|nr:YceI family protein [Flavobacterium litorale]QYJ67529.1 YceI family protein [Flavobacterium litorale]
MNTTKWVIDPTHSEIGFKVKHMMFTNVSGSFTDFEATAETDGDNFENATFNFSANVASVDTGSKDRDKHLRSGDFFDAEKFSKMTFTSTDFTKKGNGDYTLTGDLTVRDVTRPVTLNVDFGGIAKDTWGNTKAGMSATGKLNRKDFGLTWNSALETGGVLVGEEVKLHIELQFAKA